MKDVRPRPKPIGLKALDQEDQNLNPPRLKLPAINRIALAVRDGRATPREARRLMAEFVRADASDRAIPSREFRRLIHHFAECFFLFLKERKSVERALGLTKKMGHPEADKAKALD